jgi:hypothetical protein
METHRIAAHRELASRAVRSFGIPIITTATEALLGELYRTAGAVAWLDAIVQGIPEGEITRGVVSIKDITGPRPSKEIEVAAATNVWVRLWQDERRHLIAVAKACHDVRIDSARVELAQRQGELLGGVIDRILGALVLSLTERFEGVIEADVFRAAWDVVAGEVVPAQLLASVGQDQLGSVHDG